MQEKDEKPLQISRLTSQAAFDSLRKSKCRWVAPGFIVQALPEYTESGCAVCFVTSKKTAKLATDRNRIRRRLRHACADILPGALKDGVALMIVGRSDALTRSYEDLKKDMVWCLKRLGLKQSGDGHA
jgi:ribonuclease P protein component